MPRPDGRYKLKQLILYVASKMREADYFGVTKLNKVLYRANISSYQEIGRKLTEFKFQKNTRGPTLRAFVPITQEMESDGLLGWDSRPRGPVNERRPLARVEPDMSVVPAEELVYVDREISRAWSLTGKQMSAEEHVTAAWYALRTGETIAPELSFVEDPGNSMPLSTQEEERAHAAIERYRARTRASSHPRSST